MASETGQQNIRGLNIDKTVKGFALREYIFKSQINTSSTSSDEIRWYQETATDLTPTSPSRVGNLGFESVFPNLEPTWTRNSSYVKKYGAESFVGMEDMKSSDIDVLSRTLLRLTRAVVKQVDADIFDVITESQSPSNINDITSTAAWDGSGQDPIDDLLQALQKIEENDFDTTQAQIWLSPKDKRSLISWIVSTKGASIPNYSSQLLQDGVLKILNKKVVISNNVVSDYAVVLIPREAATWKSHTETTTAAIEEKGIGTKLRVWELGVTLLTTPKAVSLISNTQA